MGHPEYNNCAYSILFYIILPGLGVTGLPPGVGILQQASSPGIHSFT